MQRKTTFALIVIAIALMLRMESALGAGLVTINLVSPQSNMAVAPGQNIDWQIEAEVSEGDNAGLALILIDLVQSFSNPQFFDMTPPAQVPPVMQNFAAPNGFANPGSGYTGTLVGDIGERNLKQIGGAQNSFGQPGQSMGQSVNVDPGIGQGSPVIVVEGSFAAPPVPGDYAIFLENAVVNTFDAINTAPTASPVSPAAPLLLDAILFFTVDDTIQLRADVNCDGAVDGRDVAPFAVALADPASYPAMYPECQLSQGDVNNDSLIDTNDIADFVNCLLAGCP
jgi:hypothetical protein